MRIVCTHPHAHTCLPVTTSISVFPKVSSVEGCLKVILVYPEELLPTKKIADQKKKRASS